MANDHFIPRFLTRPWEFGERQLLTYDFQTRQFFERSSKTFFAVPDITSPRIEAILNTFIETPVADLVGQLRRRGAPRKVAELDWRTMRALTLLYVLNPQRLAEARGESIGKFSLERIAEGGADLVDQFAKAALDVWRFGVQWLPAGHELFFTSVATFPVPLTTHAELAMPLALDAVLVAGERQKPESMEWIQRLAKTGALVGLSLGIGGNAHKVVLPPAWREAWGEGPYALSEKLVHLRSTTRALCSTIAEAGRAAGIATWNIT